MFYLHPNADLTFRENESMDMIDTLALTQPKEGGVVGGGGISKDEYVKELAESNMDKLPADYVESDVRD